MSSRAFDVTSIGGLAHPPLAARPPRSPELRVNSKRSPETQNAAFAALSGAQGRSRTTDTRIFSPMLYQLSYLGEEALGARFVLRLAPFRQAPHTAPSAQTPPTALLAPPNAHEPPHAPGDPGPPASTRATRSTPLRPAGSRSRITPPLPARCPLPYPPASRTLGGGTLTTKVVPRSTSLCSLIVPPSCCISFRTTASPSPVPFGSRV